MSKEGMKTLRNSAEKMPPFFMTPLFLILRDTERRGCLKWNSLRGIINQTINVKLFQYPDLLLVNDSGRESRLTLVECFPVCWTNQRPSLLPCSAGCLPLCPALDHRPLTANVQVKQVGFRVKLNDVEKVWTSELNTLFYLTASSAGHLHIKGYLTLILIWTWWPVRTVSQHIGVKKKKLVATTCFKEHTMAFIPTYHRRSYWGWIHAAHPRGSFPCLRCG